MRARFHADPMVQATELLLQERTPRDVSVRHPRAEEVATAAQSATRSRRWSAGCTPRTMPRRRRTFFPTAAIRNADGRRFGLQPLGRYGHDALARRRNLRRDGGATSFCVTSRAASVVGGISADAASSLKSYEVTFTEDRAEFIAHRRDDRHDA